MGETVSEVLKAPIERAPPVGAVTSRTNVSAVADPELPTLSVPLTVSVPGAVVFSVVNECVADCHGLLTSVRELAVKPTGAGACVRALYCARTAAALSAVP